MALGLAAAANGPFIFSAFAARGEAAGGEGPLLWVAGEVATVEVDISNPTTIPIKARRRWPPSLLHPPGRPLLVWLAA